MSMSPAPSPLEQLLSLSHDLGRENRRLAILGEGNTSLRLDRETFLVKASGGRLADLRPESVTTCRFEPLLAALDHIGSLSDGDVDTRLLAARVEAGDRKPSVEAMFHAWLLGLPGVQCVGHTHPIAVNAILCSPRASEFAAGRLFPDEIVCCGRASTLVSYTDPGLALGRAIRRAVLDHLERHQEAPRVILLQNHGLIALGATPAAVLAATLMAVKAAEIFLGAAALGGPVFLTPENVERIAGRPDEHYRQKALGLS